MAPLLSISLLARAAITADVMALTMYVVLGLDMSYAAAGGVAAAMTAGMALGGPLLGRMIDWRGPGIALLGPPRRQGRSWPWAPLLPHGSLPAAPSAAGRLLCPPPPVYR